ncbi:TLN1 protein, partial [Mesembrinibis cayennensis]|nr:TLN1 protein [Mesembrinibis cayennensis]
MVKTAKAIAVTVQEMVTKSTTNPDELGTLANQLTNDYGQLAQEAKPAALTAENEEVRAWGGVLEYRVKINKRGCPDHAIPYSPLWCEAAPSWEVLGGCVQWGLSEPALLPSHPARTPQVSHVLAALQAGNRGTQACITAASAVSGIIADLDTTIMFATAGTLNRENSETFADHR